MEIIAGISLILNSVSWKEVTAAEPDVRSQVRAQIKQLAAASRADRTTAEQALLQLGPAILPLLPPPDLLESASVRVAIRRVRVRLEHDAAEQSLRPSTVTLAGNFSVEEIVREIEKQTGNSVSTAGLSKQQLSQRSTLKLENASFWSALGELESQNLAASFDKETGLLTLQSHEAKRSESVTTIDRSFWIEAWPLQSRRGIDDSETLLSTELRILCEPRLRPLFLTYRTNDFNLVRGDGDIRIGPFNTGASIEVPLGNGGREAGLALNFLSSMPLTKNASLNGKVNLLIAASEQPVSFRNLNLAKRVSRRRGGVTVTVHEVGYEGSRPEHHNARVRLQVSYDLGAHAFESHQTWVFHNRVYLVDPNGKQHSPNGGFTTLHQGDGSVAIEYRFEDLSSDPAEWDFVYVAPTLLINVEVPIALSRIPIVEPTPLKE
tara:strand:+ start:39583 stop:40887 length:1305 start_codon:yes stop_codon:yes gene_type:complete